MTLLARMLRGYSCKAINDQETESDKFRTDGKETSNFNFDESLLGEHVLDVYLK